MSDPKTHVFNWLAAGADAKVGLQLFIAYCNPNTALVRIVTSNPGKHLHIIKSALFKRYGQPNKAGEVKIQPVKENAPEPVKKTMREDWPFLSETSCPPELKILVGDKITAYHKYVQAYNAIPKSLNENEQFDNVRTLVENYIENHLIYKELNYYKKYGKTLGDHEIFQQFQRLKEFRNLSTLDLVKKKDQLEHNIWRNKNRIETDNRPDLLVSREKRIKKLEMELAEVMRLLE